MVTAKPGISPSVFGRNFPCKPVRGVNFREECHWSHAWQSFKRTCVRSDGIIECKILSDNAHRTSQFQQQCLCFAASGAISYLQCADRIHSANRLEAVKTRDEWHWSHAWQQHSKRCKGVKLNGILECKTLSKNAHRTPTIATLCCLSICSREAFSVCS
jgi:hypothetical protein